MKAWFTLLPRTSLLLVILMASWVLKVLLSWSTNWLSISKTKNPVCYLLILDYLLDCLPYIAFVDVTFPRAWDYLWVLWQITSFLWVPQPYFSSALQDLQPCHMLVTKSPVSIPVLCIFWHLGWGWGSPDLSEDLTQFRLQSLVRLCTKEGRGHEWLLWLGRHFGCLKWSQ